MALTILDIQDELKLIGKLIAEKKFKSEAIISAKKQIYEHLDFKYKEYVNTIAKIGREALQNQDKIKDFRDRLQEVADLNEKKIEYQKKLAVNQSKADKNLPPKYTPDHMNRLLQHIVEMDNRHKLNPIDITVAQKAVAQVSLLEWLKTAIPDLWIVKGTISEKIKSENIRLFFSKLFKAICYVTSMYVVFILVEKLKHHVPINEFILNVLIGTLAFYVIDSPLDKLKDSLFWGNALKDVSGYTEIFEKMKNIETRLDQYNF